MKRWFIPAAARARGQSNDLNRGILASNLFNCRKEVINAPPPQSHQYQDAFIVYLHKNIWDYQWSNFIYNCMSTFLHYVLCKDALLDCSAPAGERCESLTGVDEMFPACSAPSKQLCYFNFQYLLYEIYINREFGLKSQLPFPWKVDSGQTVPEFNYRATFCPNRDS